MPVRLRGLESPLAFNDPTGMVIGFSGVGAGLTQGLFWGTFYGAFPAWYTAGLGDRYSFKGGGGLSSDPFGARAVKHIELSARLGSELLRLFCGQRASNDSALAIVPARLPDSGFVVERRLHLVRGDVHNHAECTGRPWSDSVRGGTCGEASVCSGVELRHGPQLRLRTETTPPETRQDRRLGPSCGVYQNR